MGISGNQWYPGIESNTDLLHQETVHESSVRDWIGDNQNVGLQDCVGAERAISRNLIHCKADFSLKPYPLLIDESDDGDRGIAHKSG
jgi:hypothetical protein